MLRTGRWVLVPVNASSPHGGELRRFATAADFQRWLEVNHDRSAGVWLEMARRDAREATIAYGEAIEVALCFGWIDGQKGRVDDEHWRQRFSPRSRRSRWSRINRDRAERLMAAGRMRPQGLAEVERARADGRWEAAYHGQRTATVPEDLQRELDADRIAAAAFAALDARNRYSIIWRLNDAKRPETRARRLARFLDMLRRGERIH